MRRRNAAGFEARELLIRTAEELFAIRGVDAVSMREIAWAAGFRTSSAVSYHFGGKEALLHGIIEYRMQGIAAVHEARLAELQSAGRAPDLRALMNLAVRSRDELIDGDTYFGRFLGQLNQHPEWIEQLEDGVTSPAGERVTALTAAATDYLPDAIRRQRRVFAFQLNNSALAQLEYALAHGLAAEERELFVAELIEALVAIYSAPMSERTIEIASTLPRRSGRAD